MRSRARRRLRKAWDAIRAIITLGKYAIPDERAREALARADGVADAIDPKAHEDYGTPPDVP
jgi:hypothetical protein